MKFCKYYEINLDSFILARESTFKALKHSATLLEPVIVATGVSPLDFVSCNVAEVESN